MDLWLLAAAAIGGRAIVVLVALLGVIRPALERMTRADVDQERRRDLLKLIDHVVTLLRGRRRSVPPVEPGRVSRA